MKYPCKRCNGRGWLAPKRRDSFPEACACGGGTFSGPKLARFLRVSRSDVYRVERLQAGSAASVRVLDAIARFFPGEIGINSIRERVAHL